MKEIKIAMTVANGKPALMMTSSDKKGDLELYLELDDHLMSMINNHVQEVKSGNQI